MAELDKIIHERARLLILTYLASHKAQEISFNELQEKLSFSSGNLSIQLKKLIEVAYLTMNKTFKDNKPFTTVAITPEGRSALQKYVEEMESIIKTLKTSETGA